MHVLIASAWDPTSGVLTVYRALAKKLGSRGVRFSAFAFDGWGFDTQWTFCDRLLDGREITLAQVLMSGEYDVVHCVDGMYEHPYDVRKWVRRARFSGPVVLMAQSGEQALTDGAHATRYVACSPEAASVLETHADRPVEVITNGYDEDVFSPADVESSDRPSLVWVGRSYDPNKDVALFLDVVESLPQFDAVVVDADASASAIQEPLSRLGPRVKHVAKLHPPEIAHIYRVAAASGGALVSTSRSEGFPLAVVEAMACECPVVAPRITGHGHLVDGVNAYVFDRMDGVGGVVAAIRRLDDGGARNELVGRARNDAERHWGSSAMANAYFRVYEEALAETSEPPGSRTWDSVVRTVWRVALKVRPTWHRLTAVAGRAGVRLR